MKRILIILLVIFIFLFTFSGCSTIYMKESFTDFSNSTKTIGKNTTYCFEQLFDEEINSMLQEVIKALDFIPLTHKEMIRLLKYNDSPITTLDQLSNFGARLEEMYVEIAFD
jgi:uncharacterized protein YceK